jgi:hypothetical protein
MTIAARLALSTFTLAALVAGCGGGGGGTSGGGAAPPPVIAPGPVVASTNVAAAWKDYATVAHNWTMPGKGSDGRTFELSVALTPSTASAFPLTGANGQTSDQTLRFTVGGSNPVTTAGKLYFTLDNMLGVVTNDGACAGARSAMSALPTSSTVGSSGPMFVLDGYAGCLASGQKLGTTTFSWSVEKDGDVVMFCITSKQQDSNGANTGSEVDCIEASATGILGGKAKFTITRSDGNSITGRNF